MKLFITSLYLVAWLISECSGEETWLPFDEYEYYISTNTGSIGDAISGCRNLDNNAVVASIKSEDIQMFLMDILQSSTPGEYFLGAEKQVYETPILPEYFEWFDGTSIDYNKFDSSEFDNAPSDAYCVVLDASNDGKWKTEHCYNTPSKYYICQKENPNGSGGSVDTGLIAGAVAGGVIVILLVIGGFVFWYKRKRNPSTSKKKKNIDDDQDEVQFEGNVAPVSNYETVDDFQTNETNIKPKSSLYEDDNKKTEKPHCYETVEVDTAKTVIIHSKLENEENTDNTYSHLKTNSNEENTDNTYSHLKTNSNEENTDNTYSHLNTNSNEENTDNTYSQLNTDKKEEKDLYNSLQNQ